MNLLKEAQVFIGFATYCPLLYKATSDDDAGTPGYMYEEIRKISFLSHQHRVHLIDFLLDKLLDSGWNGKQKVIRILLHLSKEGHYEIRMLLRRKDGDLRKVVAYGLPHDPLLANTPSLFLNSAIQELLSYIFEEELMKSDNDKCTRGDNDTSQRIVVSGYGSHGNHTDGKYQGFGNSPVTKQNSVLNQMYDIFGKVVPSSEVQREELKKLSTTNKGNYQPLPFTSSEMFLSNANSPVPFSSLSGPLTYFSPSSPRNKGYISGKAGGGWASDNEEDEPTPLVQGLFLRDEVESSASSVENFMKNLLESNPNWPVNYKLFLSCGAEASKFGLEELSAVIRGKVNELLKAVRSDRLRESDETPIPRLSKYESNVMVILLFLEFGYYHSWIPLSVVTNCEDTLNSIIQSKSLHTSIHNKAKKLKLVLKISNYRCQYTT